MAISAWPMLYSSRTSLLPVQNQLASCGRTECCAHDRRHHRRVIALIVTAFAVALAVLLTELLPVLRALRRPKRNGDEQHQT